MLDVYTMVSVLTRHCFNWTTSESLRLEREYDLLELDVNEIAIMHQRSVNAIVHRLQAEGIIDRFADARGYDMTSARKSVIDEDQDDSDSEYEAEADEDEDEDEDQDDSDSEYEFEADEDEDEKKDDVLIKRLQQRVAQLETTISLMKKTTKSPKRKPLRSYLY